MLTFHDIERAPGTVEYTRRGNLLVRETWGRPNRRLKPEPQLGGFVGLFGLLGSAYFLWHVAKWALR